jgi:hypothetical protein
MVELYLHSSIRLHGVVFNYMYNFTVSNNSAVSVHRRSGGKAASVPHPNGQINYQLSFTFELFILFALHYRIFALN